MQRSFNDLFISPFIRVYIKVTEDLLCTFKILQPMLSPKKSRFPLLNR